MTRVETRGFTLLEMMLVIVLLASVSMMVVGALPSRGADIQREGSRLLNILHWAQEQSMLDGDIYGLSVASDGWQLLKLCHVNCGEHSIATADNVWPGAVWLAARQKSTLLRRSLKEVDLRLNVEQNMQLLSAFGENAIAPQLLFYPGGESSQFELQLVDEARQQQLALTSEGVGWVQLRNDEQ